MRPLNKNASKIFYELMEQLGKRCAVKIDNSPNEFMAVNIDRIGPQVVAIAHNYVQCGDVMADPDMMFYIQKDTGLVYPFSYQLSSLGTYQESIVFDEDGQPLSFYPKMQKDHAVFASQWMKNIKAQQGPNFSPRMDGQIMEAPIGADEQALSGA